MSVLFKFLIRSILEKKLRTFLIVFAVTLATALFFVSITISGTLKNNITEQMRQRYGGADILVQNNEIANPPFFNLHDDEMIKEKIKYRVGAVQISARYRKGNKSVLISLLGLEQSDLRRLKGINFVNEPVVWDYNAIILDEDTVNKENLSVGDKVKLNIEGLNYTLYLRGIAKTNGMFARDGMSGRAVVNKAMLANINLTGKKVNTIFIKLNQETDKSFVMKQLVTTYTNQKVKEPFTQAEIDGQISGLSLVFLQMALLVLLLSFYIVGCSFRIISIQRLPIMGTFRSIGASKKVTGLCFVFECLIYGIIGGISGCLLGIAALKLIATIIHSTQDYAADVQLEFKLVQLAVAFLTAVAICLVSSVAPLFRTLKIPLLAIILNTMDRSKTKERGWKPFAGLFSVFAALTLPAVVSMKVAGVVDPLCILLLIAGQIGVMPYVVVVLSIGFERIYMYVFGNEGILAMKNLRENKNHLNSISLIGVGISIMLLIYTVGFSILSSTVNFYTNSMKFDIMMSASYADQAYVQRLLQVKGVTGAYGVYQSMGGVKVIGKDTVIETIQGIDPMKYTDYWNLGYEGDIKPVLDKLNKGRNIVITPSLSKRLSLRIGDSLTLKWKNGSKAYKVIGIFKTMLSGGSFALISERNFRTDDGSDYFSSIYVKTSKDPDSVKEEIASRSTDPAWISTTKQLKEDELEANQQIFTILKGVILTIWSAVFFGIFNNLLISFMERKRSWAILRSIGMSKLQMLKISCLESISVGLIGGLTGVVFGNLMLTIVPDILSSGLLPQAELGYNIVYLLVCIMLSITMCLLASILPIFQSRKESLIDSIKYD